MSARVADDNGWFEIRKNPISKAGVFPYRGASINAPEPDRIYNVYRPAEELSNQATLDSFKLLPWINDHVMLGRPIPGARVVPAEQKGIHGVVGEQVGFDHSTGTMYANIKVWSSSLQKTIDAGKIDLSLGYKCKYIPDVGTFDSQPYEYRQITIRGNHLATVDDGRMGDEVVVMDENTFVTTFDAKELEQMPIDQATMDAAIAEAIKPAMTSLAALNTAIVKMQATLDAKSDDDDDDDDDDYEDDTDDDGKPVMDEAGKLKKKFGADGKKVKKMFGKDAKMAMDAAISAATKPLRDELAALKAAGGTANVAAMDAAITKATKPLTDQIEALKSGATKVVLAELGKRDALAKQLSEFVGTFDHSEMTLSEVAKYGVEKLKIPGATGAEYASVTAYLHGRTPARPAFAMDHNDLIVAGAAVDPKSSVGKYLSNAA